MRKEHIKIYFDGACGPRNPGGRCGCGAVIFKNREIIKEIAVEYIPEIKKETSNNIAEYYALLKALEFLIKEGLQDSVIQVFGDSKLVINQMKGVWKIRAGLYLEQAVYTKRALEKFSNIRFKWIPREQNILADNLSKKAIK